MADAAGVQPRTLQEFRGLLKWDGTAVRDRVQRRLAGRHGRAPSVGILDEASNRMVGARCDGLAVFVTHVGLRLTSKAGAKGKCQDARYH
jgi:hypothetical protein